MVEEAGSSFVVGEGYCTEDESGQGKEDKAVKATILRTFESVHSPRPKNLLHMLRMTETSAEGRTSRQLS